ncbi:uncharacterized protein WCC33_014223 [Rhinophrynus dorsalis]
MVLLNITGLYYPSQTLDPQTDIEDIIASQNIISRVLHSYIGILVPLGLLAGITSLAVIIRNKAQHQTLENLDFYLLNLAFTDLTIILYSFTSITRPDYMEITNLACGALSSVFNLSYFHSQYLLLLTCLMLIILDNSSIIATKANQNRLGCVFLSIIFSCVMSLVAASLLGTYKDLNSITHCQLDPLNAKLGYDYFKFNLGYCVPSFFTLLFFVILIVYLSRAEDSTMKKKVEVHMVVLLQMSVMFACRLFYNIMLLRRTGLKLGDLRMSPREELIVNIAELVVYSGSCINLMFLVILHRACRLGVWKAIQFVIKKCGGTKTYNGVEMTSTTN